MTNNSKNRIKLFALILAVILLTVFVFTACNAPTTPSWDWNKLKFWESWGISSWFGKDKDNNNGNNNGNGNNGSGNNQGESNNGNNNGGADETPDDDEPDPEPAVDIDDYLGIELSALSWPVIAAISESGRASEFFAVGDKIDITLSTDEVITLEIWGFDHDDLSDGSGKAGITFGMKYVSGKVYNMNAAETNTGGWGASRMRTVHMPAIIALFPEELTEVVKTVDKKTTAGGGTTSAPVTNVIVSQDELFILSYKELTGTLDSGYAGEGGQYEYWREVDALTSLNRLSRQDNSVKPWWLRSPVPNNNARFANFADSLRENLPATASSFIVFGFCV